MKWLRGMGVEDVRTTARTGDQGGDILFRHGGQTIVVQCKRYNGAVGNEAVQQVHAAKAFYGCTGAWVVTTGTFTPAARALALRTEVELVDLATHGRLGLALDRRCVPLDERSSEADADWGTSMGDVVVKVAAAVDARALDGTTCSVPPGHYKIVPVTDAVNEGNQVVVLEDGNGRRLPPLVTRTPVGRTVLGDALTVERASGWSDTQYQIACVYLDAWR